MNKNLFSIQVCLALSLVLLLPALAFSKACPEPQAAEVWSEPNYSSSEKGQILDQYSHIDPDHQVPKEAKEKALLMFHKHKSRLGNLGYLTIFDVSQNAAAKRLYIVGMDSGRVRKELVSHGNGSDKNRDGWASAFSDEGESNKTSLGFYVMNEIDEGSKHDFALKMDGKSSTNQTARRRCIVMHPADYVNQGALDDGGGRSQGCPALEGQTASDRSQARRLVEELKGGSLMYIHYSKIEQAMLKQNQKKGYGSDSGSN